MYWQVLQEQITAMEFPKCQHGEDHTYQILCQQKKCPKYFKPLCDTCKSQSHAHSYEGDYINLRTLLLNLTKELKVQDELFQQEQDNILQQAQQFQKFSDTCLQIHKNIVEFRTLVLNKNQQMTNILDSIIQLGPQNKEELTKTLKPVLQFLQNKYVINQEDNVLSFIHNSTNMQEELHKISLKLNQPLNYLSQILEETNRFCGENKIFQQGQQFVTEDKKQYNHCTNFFTTSYQKSQDIIVDKSKSIYQGSNQNCQFICSEEIFTEGQRQMSIQILDANNRGKFYLGIMDNDNYDKQIAFDPNPNIDIFQGNNCQMKITKGQLEIEDIIDKFQNTFNTFQAKLKTTRNKDKLKQEYRKRSNQLIFTSYLDIEKNQFEIQEEFHELNYQFTPSITKQLKGKKWRFYIIWRNSEVKIKILDQQQYKYHSKNMTYTPDPDNEEYQSHKKYYSEQFGNNNKLPQ